MSIDGKPVIRKAQLDVYSFLNANRDKTIDQVFDQLVELLANKKVQVNTLYYPTGELKAQWCYYHKCWELFSIHSYGTKPGKTGYNCMCKEGNKFWTRQNTEFKKSDLALLKRCVKDSSLDYDVELAKLVLHRARIEPSSMAEVQENYILLCDYVAVGSLGSFGTIINKDFTNFARA